MLIDIKAVLRNICASSEVKTQNTPEEIGLSFQGFEFVHPVDFEGVITGDNDGVIFLKGKVSTVWTSRCARCIDEVSSIFESGVDVTFRPRYNRDKYGQEDADSDDEYTYSGCSIELDSPLRDILIFALPTKVLCDPDCKGICEWNGNTN